MLKKLNQFCYFAILTFSLFIPYFSSAQLHFGKSKAEIEKIMGVPDKIDISAHGDVCISYESILELTGKAYPVVVAFYFDMELICHAHLFGYPRELASSLIKSFNESYTLIDVLIWKDVPNNTIYELYLSDQIVSLYVYIEGNKYGYSEQ